MIVVNFLYDENVSVEQNFINYLHLKAKSEGITREETKPFLYAYFYNNRKQATADFLFETNQTVHIESVPHFIDKVVRFFIDPKRKEDLK